MPFSLVRFRKNPQGELEKCSVSALRDLATRYGIILSEGGRKDPLRKQLIDGFILKAVELSEQAAAGANAQNADVGAAAGAGENPEPVSDGHAGVSDERVIQEIRTVEDLSRRTASLQITIAAPPASPESPPGPAADARR